MGDWVILELNQRGEQEDPELLRSAIAHTLKNAEIFVPSIVTKVGDARTVHPLMDGYAFVKLDRPPADYFKLEGTRYVQTILVRPGAGSRYRRISTITDRDILKMQDQIKQLVDQGIGVGDVVRITSGPYRDIRATVVEEIPEQGVVQVYIKLRSKQSLMRLPRSFLVVVERAPFSSVAHRINVLRDWAQNVRPIFEWTDSFAPVITAYKAYEKVAVWAKKGSDLYQFLRFEQTLPSQLKELQTRSAELLRVEGWRKNGSHLFSFLKAYQKDGLLDVRQFGKIEGKLLELVWIDDLLERVRMLWEDIDSIGRATGSRQEGKDMVDNVLVDGHNLAFRCLYAPGMASLTDSQGRPTGMILGFLRSLGSLKKRFPNAMIHVVWDGSSRRRKARFGEYKANRNTPPVASEVYGIRFDPVAVLKGIIPLLGIRQAWNPDEEADDVLATLVRGELAAQTNVIFSTDKDLLQLVTPTTSVLTPAVGSRNEILYDPGTVVKALGVPPGRWVQLRSLYGDSSDNIPGVPRVPKKILRSLIITHGSIDHIYKSGLAGLTKGQYDRLRGAEPQVRINVELMTLLDVSVTATPPDVDPDSVTQRLRELEINPDSLLDTFFGSER